MTEWNATAYNRLSNPMLNWEHISEPSLRARLIESITDQSAPDDPPLSTGLLENEHPRPAPH